MTKTHAGIFLLLLSTSAGALGSVLQKRAVDRLPPLESRGALGAVRALATHPTWVLGWLLTTAGIVLNLVALGLAELTLLQPLHGFGLVVLAALSHAWLKERVGARELAGIGIAIVGVTWLGMSAHVSTPTTTPTLATTSTLATTTALATSPSTFDAYAAPLAFVWYALALLLVAVPWIVSARRAYRGASVAFAIVAAAFSVAGFTFAKGPSALLSASGLAAFASSPLAWLLAAAFLACSTAAIVLQQVSLQKGSAVVAVPVFNLVSMVLPLAPGALVFTEPLGAHKLGAVAVILAGAALLSTGSANEPRSIAVR